MAGHMTGKELVSLMRKHQVTIKDLSKPMGITMKRIRQVREVGLGDANAVRDWVQMVTGQDPGEPRGNFLELGVCPQVGKTVWVLVNVPGDVNCHPVPGVVDRVDKGGAVGLGCTYLSVTTAAGTKRVCIDSTYTHRPELRDTQDAYGILKKWVVPSAEEESKRRGFQQEGRAPDRGGALPGERDDRLADRGGEVRRAGRHSGGIRRVRAGAGPGLRPRAVRRDLAGHLAGDREREPAVPEARDPVRMFTTAPVDYDGFGTRTVAMRGLGRRPGAARGRGAASA